MARTLAIENLTKRGFWGSPKGRRRKKRKEKRGDENRKQTTGEEKEREK